MNLNAFKDWIESLATIFAAHVFWPQISAFFSAAGQTLRVQEERLILFYQHTLAVVIRKPLWAVFLFNLAVSIGTVYLLTEQEPDGAGQWFEGQWFWASVVCWLLTFVPVTWALFRLASVKIAPWEEVTAPPGHPLHVPDADAFYDRFGPSNRLGPLAWFSFVWTFWMNGIWIMGNGIVIGTCYERPFLFLWGSAPHVLLGGFVCFLGIVAWVVAANLVGTALSVMAGFFAGALKIIVRPLVVIGIPGVTDANIGEYLPKEWLENLRKGGQAIDQTLSTLHETGLVGILMIWAFALLEADLRLVFFWTIAVVISAVFDYAKVKRGKLDTLEDRRHGVRIAYAVTAALFARRIFEAVFLEGHASRPAAWVGRHAPELWQSFTHLGFCAGTVALALLGVVMWIGVKAYKSVEAPWLKRGSGFTVFLSGLGMIIILMGWIAQVTGISTDVAVARAETHEDETASADSTGGGLAAMQAQADAANGRTVPVAPTVVPTAPVVPVAPVIAAPTVVVPNPEPVARSAPRRTEAEGFDRCAGLTGRALETWRRLGRCP